MIREATQRLQTARFLREIALVAVAYLAYYLVRSAAAGKVLDAFANAHLIVRAEQAMGIFVELPLQVAVLSYGGLTDFFSLYYFWGHFPLIIAFAIWAFYRHHDEYRWTRNAIFLSGGVALIVYLTFPVAPPRLLPGAGFVDTLRDVFALRYDSSDLVNQYAAVPSIAPGLRAHRGSRALPHRAGVEGGRAAFPALGADVREHRRHGEPLLPGCTVRARGGRSRDHPRHPLGAPGTTRCALGPAAVAHPSSHGLGTGLTSHNRARPPRRYASGRDSA